MKTYRFVLDIDRLRVYGISVIHRVSGVDFTMAGLGLTREASKKLFLECLEKGFVRIEEV